MSKLHRLISTDVEEKYIFFCPGCQNNHAVRTRGPSPVWNWNQNVEAPTFSPSIMVNRGHPTQCHSFVTDGKIAFLADSCHHLAGQTVEIPNWEEELP